MQAKQLVSRMKKQKLQIKQQRMERDERNHRLFVEMSQEKKDV